MYLENSQYCVKTAIDRIHGDDKSFDLTLNANDYEPNDLPERMSIEVLCKEVSSEFKIAIIARLYSDDEDYAILENNILTVLQNDIIVQIDLESRALIRRVTINSLGCNFGIYYVNHRYIVYGEIEITCFDSDFNTMWSFSGYDIFLSPTNKKCFEIVGETIKLYDFYDNYYEIDLNGVARHP